MRKIISPFAFLAISFSLMAPSLDALRGFDREAAYRSGALLSQAYDDSNMNYDDSQGSAYHDESYDGYFNNDLGTNMGSRWYNMPSGR